jgi:hypothetical protein
VYQLILGYNIAYDSVNREVLHNSVIECVINLNLVILTKMHLNDTYNRDWVAKHLYIVFPIKNIVKKGDVLLPLLFNLEYA